MKTVNATIATVAAILFALTPHSLGSGETQSQVFEQIWQTVKDKFFDPKLRGVDWVAEKKRYQKQAEDASSQEAFAEVVNRMLAELKTSHTYYYTPQDPQYYQLAAIFWSFLESKLKPFLHNGSLDYVGIGISTEAQAGKIFVHAVYDGSPAALAGVKLGDQIADVDGKPFHPIRSFADKEGKPARLRVQRESDLGSDKVIVVQPKRFDPTTMFLDAMKASVKLIEKERTKVGYVHVWSYAGEIYQEELEDELNGRLRDADGLVLDLRDGWGGANANYLWPFVAPPVTITSITRDGKRTDYSAAWRKPVALLVNDGSRSGKEIFTYYFRKAHCGPIIGSRTAGAVMAGQPFVMKDGSLLYLAVGDGLVDGVRPEGHGIVPDVEVPFRIEYAGGADPQKERAIDEIVKAAHK